MERVLKRKRGGNIEYFVKWKGYGDKFNTSIIKENVIALCSNLANMHHGSIVYQSPSNSSINIYPENRTSLNVIKLPDEIHLTGQWEIELKEIQYPHRRVSQ